MPSTYTLTRTMTRTQAVTNEFNMFLRYSGLAARYRDRILAGVEERWLSHVGVFLLSDRGQRILEAEISVDWAQHAEFASLSPTIRTDLPGWEDGASPEIIVIGQQFGREAQAMGRDVHCWVRFTAEIRRNPNRHQSLCDEVGVLYQSTVPKWESDPEERSYTVVDLNEMRTAYRHV
jgi:hypothetical protein